MARQVYRKSLLERMSSPDQLDKLIVVTSPAFWLALIGGAIIIVVALIWSIFGRLPVKMEAVGIYVPSNGAYSLATDTGGIVSEVNVEVGQQVKEGDILVKLQDSDIKRELENLKARREKVEAVTLESDGDVVTSDNTDLINIKTQLSTVDMEKQQQETMMAQYQNDLKELEPKITEAKKKMDKAKNDYYSYLRSTSDSQTEIAYNEAQSDYNRKVSYYESAKSSFSSCKINYINSLESISSQLSKQIKSASDSKTKKMLSSALSSLNSVKDKLKSPSELNADAQTVLSSYLETLNNLWSQYTNAKDAMNVAKADYDESLAAYESAKNAYKDYVSGRSDTDAEKERVYAIYSNLSNEYSQLQSKKSNLESNIASIKGQLSAAQISSDDKSESYKKQFEATRASVLSSLDEEIKKDEYSLSKTEIKATVAGTVTDVKVKSGAALGQGSEVVTIRQKSEDNLVMCYIPISSGKKVQPGMEVVVTPTTVNQQEYGHMEAEVVSVDNYVATSSSIKSLLGDDTLVQSFTQNGPVVGVVCRLKEDASTASGYYWTNKKGADIVIEQGTLMSAEIITEEKAPISMIIPLLKEKLTMAMKPEQQTQAANGGGQQ